MVFVVSCSAIGGPFLHEVSCSKSTQNLRESQFRPGGREGCCPRPWRVARRAPQDSQQHPMHPEHSGAATTRSATRARRKEGQQGRQSPLLTAQRAQPAARCAPSLTALLLRRLSSSQIIFKRGSHGYETQHAEHSPHRTVPVA